MFSREPHPPQAERGRLIKIPASFTGRGLRGGVLMTYDLLYQQLLRPLIFNSMPPQEAHERVINLLRWCDSQPHLQERFKEIRRFMLPLQPIEVGGVLLDSPLILAAGFVKGNGFENEGAALNAVQGGENIIPGWRTMPTLVGNVEFGSFTRWPRMGNSGTVIWRDEATHSTQNRIGLKNPGVMAASEFLRLRFFYTPPRTQGGDNLSIGINIAVSPGVVDKGQEKQEILESLATFISRGICPAWFTLNLSCPNTEDDPSGNQTEAKARDLCGAAAEFLGDLPLWVKISPDLTDEQLQKLMRVFADVGVRAVIATNTLGQPSPSNPSLRAGVGGGGLHAHAVRVAGLLAEEKRRYGYSVDVIGCGGVWNKSTYYDFVRVGVPVVQYWSALVYRGVFAAALIR